MATGRTLERLAELHPERAAAIRSKLDEAINLLQAHGITAVPEPTLLGVMALGGLGLLRRRKCEPTVGLPNSVLTSM